MIMMICFICAHAGRQAATPSAKVGLTSLEHKPCHEPPLTQHDLTPFLLLPHFWHEPHAATPRVKVGVTSFEHWPSHEPPFAQHDLTPFLFLPHVWHESPGASVGAAAGAAHAAMP